MECNKDEAIRAKTIAEAKLEQKDYSGAKKFALKAQSLYPELDGISQMLTTIEVFLSAEAKINGNIDWYRVLGVDPMAEENVIKRNYRKLALALHPDKNWLAAAADAFKLVGEGWNMLSDRIRRLTYDMAIGVAGFSSLSETLFAGDGPSTYTGPSAHAGGPWTQADDSTSHHTGPFANASNPLGQSGSPFAHAGGVSSHRGPSTQNDGPSDPSQESPFARFVNRKPPAPRPPKKNENAKSSRSMSSPPSSGPKVETFWTMCSNCEIMFEYDVMYQNKTLVCIECKKTFFSTQISRPASRGRPVEQHRLNEKNNAPSSGNDGKNNAPTPTSDVENSEAAPDVSVSQAAPPPPVSDERPMSDGPGAGSNCRKDTISEPQKSGEGSAAAHPEAPRSAGQPSRARKSSGIGKKRKTPDQTANLGGPSKASMRARMLMLEKTRGRKELSMKLKEPSPTGPTVEPKVDSDEMEGSTNPSSNNSQQGRPCKRAKTDPRPKDASDEKYSGEAMDVSDPDIYDFDRDRTGLSFKENEVWAAYDDDDGMPRLYAMVQRVLSRSPFKVQMSWLNSKTTTEFGPLDWIGSGFPKTCGEFRIGKYEVFRFLNAFSHRMRWTGGPRGAVVILPKKGEAWALYRNWSAEWGPETPDDVVHEYDMVSVVEDYESGGGGVTVARLEKVLGYSTVFRPSMGESGLLWIPKEEMYRLSHQVPHHKLAVGEVAGALEGWVELDPAAMPKELLQRMVEDGGEGPSGGEGAVEGGGGC